MITLTSINEWIAHRQTLAGKRIGFIPTMGNLHDGHLSLCARSLQENEVTVVSVFVNRTQFNQQTDFDAYPRTLVEDGDQLASLGVDYLLIPDANEMYPDGYTVKVSESDIATLLEGEFRPGHFTGMLTIVMKLLNLVSPTHAYFGEKDFQQLLLVKKMVAALFMPITIVGCETSRAADGLALSSRNARLSSAARSLAPEFPRLLMSSMSVDEVSEALTTLGFKVEYITERWGRRLGAVWLDNVRLIDNVEI